MHIGCGKVGNVQRTRPYITGRVFWGGLTMRLTRKEHKPATNSDDYQKIGKEVHGSLAYTYFYPATKSGDRYPIAWHWENESLFRRRFLSSYASTALVYPQQAAAEGLLHEVEFLSPRTLDTGEQVYLIGYVFEKDGCKLEWRDACKQLQMGGERGYGWGAVECMEVNKTTLLFDENLDWTEQNGSLAIHVLESGRLLAHTIAQNVSAQGEVEPLVGREWRSHNPTNRHAGQHLEFCGLCYSPGSTVERLSAFVIREFGIWHPSA
jgi:hypothetical protein